MQAIVTKYLPATKTRGSRIKAKCERGSITISYPYELDGDKAHIAAAQALVDKFVKEDAAKYGTNKNPWSEPRTCGALPDGGYVHVFADKFNNQVIVNFADQQDMEHFMKYKSMAEAQDGTVGGLWAGLVCSALKRAAI